MTSIEALYQLKLNEVLKWQKKANDLHLENLKLRKALDEIGTAAASVLDEENIRDWDEGGRLGDALIGIKDIIATFYIDEKLDQRCQQCGKDDLPLNQQSHLCVRCAIDNEQKIGTLKYEYEEMVRGLPPMPAPPDLPMMDENSDW